MLVGRLTGCTDLGVRVARWQTIVPLYDCDAAVQEPVRFARSLVFTRLPEWLKQDKMIASLSSQDQHSVRSISCGFVADYEADALHSPDPLSEQGRSIQDVQFELAAAANFAIWLARPSPARFRMVFDCPFLDSGGTVMRWTIHPWLVCHPKDAETRCTSADVRRAAELHVAMYQARGTERYGRPFGRRGVRFR